MTVYIITRGRIDNVAKIVPSWLVQGISVVLCIEKSEWDMHRELVRSNPSWEGVSIIKHARDNQGVGYARREAVAHAEKAGLKSIIMSDDDMRPSNGSNMKMLLSFAEDSEVLGVGAVRTLHDRYSNGATKVNDGPILCPGGWGMQLFALNIANTVEVGNFDAKLDVFGEDHELMRNGIVNGMPWLVHCGVKSESLGKRYNPGGINSLVPNEDFRKAREHACQMIIHNRWPNYTSAPPMKSRMSWQKMMDDYIEDWRSLSFMHGGSW